MKKILSLFLSVFMVFSLFSITSGYVIDVKAKNSSSSVVRIQDTETWYSDETKKFNTLDSFWNDVITETPTDYVIDENNKKVEIGSADALVWWEKEVNAGKNFSGYTVCLTSNIDLSAHYWTPICTGTVSYSSDGKYSIANNKVLQSTVFDGNGYSINGLTTSTGVRGPNQDSKPGDGQNCYYDSAFIGYNCCDITFQNLNFNGARIAICNPFDEVVNTYGSSMIAVIVGAQNGGSLTLKNVNIDNANVLAMQKASAFVGNLLGESTLSYENCSITNSTFSGYFMVAPIASYGKSSQVVNGGIKLENNTIQVVEQSSSSYTFDSKNQAEYWEGELNATSTALFYDGNTAAGKGTVLDFNAEISGYDFVTLQDAINHAGDGSIIVLLDDVTEDVIIPNNANVVIDLNGHTITNVSNHTIYNQGDLQIIGEGTVDNITHGKAAVYNEVGATATLDSGTYTRSLENGSSATENGGNSYYVLLNHGNMVINKDVSVTQDGKYSSMIENGWYNGKENINALPSTLIINGGQFSGGLNTIKNDDYGNLTINDGTFENIAQSAVLNWNETVINGGSFTSGQNVVLNGKIDDYMDKGVLKINGGTFKAGEKYEVIAKMSGGNDESLDNITITGGTFSSDVTKYIVEGTKLIQTDTGYQIVPVTTGVALDKTSVTLNEKETTTLTATLAPEGAVETLEWTTDNAKVATVDENGKVTAVAPGKATITVKAGTFEASCTVTVNAVSEVTVETPAIDTTNKDEVQAGLTAGDQTAAQEVIKDTVEQIKDVAGNEQTVVNAVSTAVTEGKDITTELVINKVEENKVASEDITAVETALSYLQDKAGATSGTVAQYLDINVLVKVDGTTVGELNQLSKEITVSIAIPTELQTEGRQFYVIRVHGDEITRLPLTKNADGTYSFKTDRFSTYALVYVDGATESYLTGNESIAIKPVTTPPTSGNTETTKPNTETPETSAAMFGGMFVTMAVLSAGIAVVLWKKRELSK
ncbi:Ig-like domain-containing protein [Merdibacter massiliensis]|uniref:Ig-like domain-containing protein n=1 Tax=Merdibacter massiliensis TaxID=1871030 RepID=UPI00096A6506|nr:Ig-like domain-containing protein [Merdibacter massiliensis]